MIARGNIYILTWYNFYTIGSTYLLLSAADQCWWIIRKKFHTLIEGPLTRAPQHNKESPLFILSVVSFLVFFCIKCYLETFWTFYHRIVVKPSISAGCLSKLMDKALDKEDKGKMEPFLHGSKWTKEVSNRLTNGNSRGSPLQCWGVWINFLEKSIKSHRFNWFWLSM